MRGFGVRHAVVTLVAAALYFVLSYYLLDLAFVLVPRSAWIQEAFGSLAEGLIWAHLAHGLALLVAALPSAILITLAAQPRTMPAAAIAGSLTALAGFAPTFLNASVRPLLGATFIGSMAVDGIKFVLLLVLVTWIVGKLPANNAMQRSARVVTPLAGRPSGAPTRAAADRER